MGGKTAFLSFLSNSKDSGCSLLSSMTLAPSSPSPSYSESKPGGGSLLNGPHSYSQASEGIKVSRRVPARGQGRN